MPHYKSVVDPAAPCLEAFRRVRERDLVGRQGRFVVEGEVVLRTALKSGRFPLRQVLLAENRLAGLKEVLTPLGDAVEILIASQAVMDQVVGFPIHRGVLASVSRSTTSRRTL